ncbi:Gfo/Idh/MocA family oxidoreductase [Cognatishimia sp. SS12]|uniref:Gfo/Idh/MocA family protein n=1 Tax=Cognatishimia sp. SS12 TaxID=2979465 RepID=UPI00232F8C46|nr:Gfo/Idh/MocA family oxidoreductase [Cognatishimia sp. SS12]MDC0736826.1 Gfo/Idh/MocA family oxidoreductase [Cognatishimia sp. SS12]
MTEIAIIGCGFVADLYMRSFARFPHVTLRAAYDRDTARRDAFCAHWNIAPADSLEALLSDLPAAGLVLNLTNPGSHYAINMACLEAGHHVYSEKPLAIAMEEAQAITALARSQGLQVASAPCSVLSEAAQTMGKALRDGVAGTPRLIYAELDDGFIPQAPFESWHSESGAPWPAQDEFEVGCTLEHAGYYLSWLIAWFGPVKTVVAAAAEVLPDKSPSGRGTPDFSCATLFFHDGPVVRLTCSIVAPHDHQIRVIGDKGVLRLTKAWDNSAPVRFYRRLRIRRRLLESPLGRRMRLAGPRQPKMGRWGAASMNFALGPVEMLEAIAQNRPCRLGGDFALHLNEVTLAIQNAGSDTGAQDMTTTCTVMEPMPWAR